MPVYATRLRLREGRVPFQPASGQTPLFRLAFKPTAASRVAGCMRGRLEQGPLHGTSWAHSTAWAALGGGGGQTPPHLPFPSGPPLSVGPVPLACIAHLQASERGGAGVRGPGGRSPLAMAAEAAEAAPAAPQPAGAGLLKKLVLRLDDGTLIKAAGGEGGDAKAAAVVLRPGDAYTGGKLTEAHLLKAQVLLCEAHAKLPDEGPLRSLSLGSKRSADTGFEVRRRRRPAAGGAWPAPAAACTAARLGGTGSGTLRAPHAALCSPAGLRLPLALLPACRRLTGGGPHAPIAPRRSDLPAPSGRGLWAARWPTAQVREGAAAGGRARGRECKLSAGYSSALRAAGAHRRQRQEGGGGGGGASGTAWAVGPSTEACLPPKPSPPCR